MAAVSVFFVQHRPSRLCRSPPPDMTTATTTTTTTTTTCSRRVSLEYLDEGGANVVFRIRPDDDHQLLPPGLQGRLLRLRKNLPHLHTADEQLNALDAYFRHLFPPENLVQLELIELEREVLQLLNESLEGLRLRPRHRTRHLLPVEHMSGLLVTDMTPRPGEVLLQLKPKWLTQSPNAPADAKRCRTCAVRSQRASQCIRTATDALATCPLDLLNPDLAQRARAVHALSPDPRLREALLTQAQPLLRQLQSCQSLLDRPGVLRTSGPHPLASLCRAMTLRDCTLFLLKKPSADAAAAAAAIVHLRLGDLDLKSPEKLPRWRKVESDLIAGGWYTNTEHRRHWRPETICLLSRT